MGARIKDAASVVQTLAGNLVGEPDGCWFYAPDGRVSTRTSPQFYVGITRYVQVRKFLLELRTGKKATADVFSACANISCVAPHHAVERVVKRRPGGDYSHLSPGNTRMKRFLRHVEKQPGPDGHWLWVGAMGRTGYGVFVWDRCETKKSGRTLISANRASMLLHGKEAELANGRLACHTCRHRHCVNPDHLFGGTHADNTADAIRGKTWGVRPKVGHLRRRPKGKHQFPVIHKIALICEQCGAVYVRKRCLVAQGKATRFCSIGCVYAEKRSLGVNHQNRHLQPNREYQQAANLPIRRKPSRLVRRKTSRTVDFSIIPCAHKWEGEPWSTDQNP